MLNDNPLKEFNLISSYLKDSQANATKYPGVIKQKGLSWKILWTNNSQINVKQLKDDAEVM